MSEQPSGAMKLVRRVFPKVPNFFGLLQAQSAVAVTSMNHLVDFMTSGQTEVADEVKAFEREASVLKEQSMAAPNSAFSTPMDREDLYRAISTLHRITTYARTTVREMEQLHVQPDEWTTKMAELLRDGVVALDEGYQMLEQDPAAAETKADRARVSERRVEKQYRLALAELFDPEEDVRRIGRIDGPTGAAAYTLVMEVFKKREIYRHMSNAGDRVARAGETLHDIVVKLV